MKVTEKMEAMIIHIFSEYNSLYDEYSAELLEKFIDATLPEFMFCEINADFLGVVDIHEHQVYYYGDLSDNDYRSMEVESFESTEALAKKVITIIENKK